MKRRGHPEGDLQRDIVELLRTVLPPEFIVHHSKNEVSGGDDRARLQQAIAQAMGVHPGFTDLIVIGPERRILFLEVKTLRGRLSPAQERFRDAVQSFGFPWAAVRSLDDVLIALERVSFPTRISRRAQALDGRAALSR